MSISAIDTTKTPDLFSFSLLPSCVFSPEMAIKVMSLWSFYFMNFYYNNILIEC